MLRPLILSLAVGLGGLAIFSVGLVPNTTQQLQAQNPQQKRNLDVTKRVMERPIENLITAQPQPFQPKSSLRSDLPNAGIESPAKSIVNALKIKHQQRLANSNSKAKSNLKANSTANSKQDNPKVAAGKVNWHANFETAINKSTQSGKPVFLFQMMGNLDQEFC